MKRLKFKKELKEKLRRREYVEYVANLAGVTPATIRNWLDTDNLKLYSYPIIRRIAIKLNCRIDELFEKN